MKTIAVIAEFNPFHKGHEYLIKEAKRLSGADRVIIIMSGNYVQRGEPALWNKFLRSKAAVLSGADLVLELPVCFSTGSAQVFADGAVSILNDLGVVDELWFGSESGHIEIFETVSSLLEDEPKAFSCLLKEYLKSGMTFPAARSKAIQNHLNTSDIADFMSSPNNILGLEYCIALKKHNSTIIPKTIKRKGAGYNDTSAENEFCSASAIRQLITGTGSAPDINEKLKDMLPEFYFNNEVLTSVMNKNVTADDLSLLLHSKLLAESEESLAEYQELTPDLAKRIKQHENKFTTFSEFALLIKSRNYTYSHISRCLLHIVLGLKHSDLEAAKAYDYIRILSIGEKCSVLGAIKAKCRKKLCMRPAELKNVSYEKELFVSNLYEAVFASKYEDYIHEYSRRF